MNYHWHVSNNFIGPPPSNKPYPRISPPTISKIYFIPHGSNSRIPSVRKAHDDTTCYQAGSSVLMYVDSIETRGDLSVASITCGRHGFLIRKREIMMNASYNTTNNKMKKESHVIIDPQTKQTLNKRYVIIKDYKSVT